jgi:hypothetical protein
MAKKNNQGTGRGDSVSTKPKPKPGDKKTSDNRNTIKKKNITKGKKSKSKHDKSKNAHIDWIASLARDNASNNDGTEAKIPSKEDRKLKRESKKNRRMEQQREKELQQQQQQRPRQRSIQENVSENSVSQQQLKPRTKGHTSSTGPSSSSSLSLRQQSRSSLLLKLTKQRFRRLKEILQTIRKDQHDEIKSTKVHPQPYYDLPKSRNEKALRTSHSTCELKKRKRRKWSKDSIQPLRSDYSGIGLARISMYIEFIDPSYSAKLEEEFREHIPGFFGKQRTKAMKKQTDGNMLWRRLADEKKNNNNKKFKGMSADERVQAMIDSTDRAGLLG